MRLDQRKKACKSSKTCALSAPAPLVLRCRLMSLNQGLSGLHRNYLVDDHRAVGALLLLAFG